MDKTILHTNHPHRLEQVPDGEAEMIERVMQIQLDVMKKRQDPSKRGQHPKTQALLRAEFEVLPQVPEAMRVGLFAQPKTYSALVRFSTALKPSDASGQAHGCAVKVLGVEGTPAGTQDFIFIDQPTFFVRDVAQYIELFELFGQDEAGMGAFAAKHRELAGLMMSFNVSITSHLERPYWAEVPIAMGDGAARLNLTPFIENVSGRESVTTPDGLREALHAHLIEERRPARFILGAQAFVDQATTPIENATSVWPTPFEPVATITIHPQDFTGPEQYAFGEGLSFTPWRCAPAHQPLGGIQRTRKRVYEQSTSLRRSLSGASQTEPTHADLERLGRIFELHLEDSND